MTIRCPFCYRLSPYVATHCQTCGRLLSVSGASASRPIPPRYQREPVYQEQFRGGMPTGLKVLIGWVCLLTLTVGFAMTAGRRMLPARFAKKVVVAQEVTGSQGELRDNLLRYFSQPNLSGSQFERQVLGEARLELLRVDAGDVYFSFPATAATTARMNKSFSLFIANPGALEQATEQDGKLIIGETGLEKRDDRARLFRTSIGNIHFDPERKLSFEFTRASYTVSLREAFDYLTNQQAQGGNLQIRVRDQRNRRDVIYYNHGTYVARRGEPSLKRFVEDLTRDISDKTPGARERKIQRLLEFVTQEITYDQSEAEAEEEILKHPVETLISHYGDCSNKTILLGSMLEQLHEDYLFLYFPDHIAVAVREGDFQSGNDLILNWDREKWTMAETTARGFVIGKSRLRNPNAPLLLFNMNSVLLIQRPQLQNQIVSRDPATEVTLY
ncbi:MAG: hypothetical protein ACKV2V_08570 [Blastocatellia bacterium]